MLASAQAVRLRLPHTLRTMALGPLRIKKIHPKRRRRTSQRQNRSAQKQCADKNLGTKFRQRGISLYLAVLIGRVFCTFLPIVDDLPSPARRAGTSRTSASADAIRSRDRSLPLKRTRGPSTLRRDRPTPSRSCYHWALVIKFCTRTECSGDWPCSQSLSAPSQLLQPSA